MSAEAAAAEATPDLGRSIIEHVSNGPAILPLHVGPLDLSISKHVVMLWISATITFLLLVWYARHVARSADGAPKGRLGTMVDVFVVFIRDQIVMPFIGPKWARAWTPLITAYFFFIVINNLIGLTPFVDAAAHWVPGLGGLEHGSSTATGNFNVTAGLAIVTFFAIIAAGSLAHGAVKHWVNMVPHGMPLPVLALLIPIEVLSMFVKPFALTMRLAANMTAGHIAIVAIMSLIFIFKSALVGFGAVPLAGALMCLEIIVCFVQAYVFTLLSAVFIGMAIHVHH